MKVVPNLCSICRHRRKGLACAAFPDRIPGDIRRMYADHRQVYPGDHDIQFAVVDAEEAREQLQKVRVLHKPRARPNDLDRRLAAVLPGLHFKDTKERRQFTLAVLQVDSFEQLPLAYQQLILDAEQKNGDGSVMLPS